MPEKGQVNLKGQLFGLEANFEKLQAIDFKKGCFVGQENTARMKLKNKLRRRLLPISSNEKLNSVASGPIATMPLREAREAFEREYLVTQINRFNGNISKTAKFVGMERSALHRKLKSLGVVSVSRAQKEDS